MDRTGSGCVMMGDKRCRRNKNAGFSLLELLIAVVILSIIVIPLLHLFLSSNRMNIKSRQTLRATTLAQNLMEGLKAYDIEELKAQFEHPTEGFNVIDDSLIRGALAEETALEVDDAGNPSPGIYYFSIRKVSMQGSEFDALIRVDAREYMEPGTHRDALNNDSGKPLVLNKPIADARSIDKENGTFVETEEIRKSVLNSIWAIENENLMMDATLSRYLQDALAANGVDAEQFRENLCFKNLERDFDTVSRTITVTLNDSTSLDQDGRRKIEVSVRQEYGFNYSDFICYTTGDDSHRVDGIGCGHISRAHPNINIFYYPLYGSNVIDESITIIDNTDPALSQPTDERLSVLIAKQVPSSVMDPGNLEMMTDAQLMAAEMDYRADVMIKKGSGDMPKEQFTLKTNLGMNLAGQAYMTGEGEAVDAPDQLTVNGESMDLNGTSRMNLYTLDGVRSPMGTAPAEDEVTELFYQVQVSVYHEGAADNGFPEEECVVVIDGSKNG